MPHKGVRAGAPPQLLCVFFFPHVCPLKYKTCLNKHCFVGSFCILLVLVPLRCNLHHFATARVKSRSKGFVSGLVGILFLSVSICFCLSLWRCLDAELMMFAVCWQVLVEGFVMLCWRQEFLVDFNPQVAFRRMAAGLQRCKSWIWRAQSSFSVKLSVALSANPSRTNKVKETI